MKKDSFITITGGTGFLGKHVIKELWNRGYKNLVVIPSKAVDLTKENIDRYVEKREPAAIIHLAALCGGIGANRQNPEGFLEQNLRMNLNVVETWKKYPNNKLVALGSVCSYPKDAAIPFIEEDLWNGYPEETNAPYGIAKRVLMEHMRVAQLCAGGKEYGCVNIFNLKGCFLVPVNLYGPCDDFSLDKSHVIPALIRKFEDAAKLKNDEVTVWGSGQCFREFLYVADAAEAIVDAMEKRDSMEPVNIGTGETIQIKELVELIATLTDFKGTIVWDTKMPDGQPFRQLDTTKALAEFGWKAKTPLDEGLRKTIMWYRDRFKSNVRFPRPQIRA